MLTRGYIAKCDSPHHTSPFLLSIRSTECHHAIHRVQAGVLKLKFRNLLKFYYSARNKTKHNETKLAISLLKCYISFLRDRFNPSPSQMILKFR